MTEEEKEKKIKYIKYLRELECKGIQLNKFYTINDSLEELKFAYELEKKQFEQDLIKNKLNQMCKMVSVGLEIIDPESSAVTPLNPDNWGDLKEPMLDFAVHHILNPPYLNLPNNNKNSDNNSDNN